MSFLEPLSEEEYKKFIKNKKVYRSAIIKDATVPICRVKSKARYTKAEYIGQFKLFIFMLFHQFELRQFMNIKIRPINSNWNCKKGYDELTDRQRKAFDKLMKATWKSLKGE